MAAITLAEAKAYLRVDNTVEDDLITKLIGSATATVENVLRQSLSAFDPLPDDAGILYKKHFPVIEPVSVGTQSGLRGLCAESLGIVA